MDPAHQCGMNNGMASGCRVQATDKSIGSDVSRAATANSTTRRWEAGAGGICRTVISPAASRKPKPARHFFGYGYPLESTADRIGTGSKRGHSERRARVLRAIRSRRTPRSNWLRSHRRTNLPRGPSTRNGHGAPAACSGGPTVHPGYRACSLRMRFTSAMACGF